MAAMSERVFVMSGYPVAPVERIGCVPECPETMLLGGGANVFVVEKAHFNDEFENRPMANVGRMEKKVNR